MTSNTNPKMGPPKFSYGDEGGFGIFFIILGSTLFGIPLVIASIARRINKRA